MRASYNGITSAFQADDRGSIPLTRLENPQNPADAGFWGFSQILIFIKSTFLYLYNTWLANLVSSFAKINCSIDIIKFLNNKIIIVSDPKTDN